jgi:hypothetical protein
MSALSRGGTALEGSPVGDRHRSLAELKAFIERFLAETNDDPKPFVWTTNSEMIITDGA